MFITLKDEVEVELQVEDEVEVEHLPKDYCIASMEAWMEEV